MFSCDFSIKACAWLLSAETWSNEHARGLSEYNRRSKSSVLAAVCVNATQQQTLLAQRDNFCWRTSAKKANPRVRDLAKKIRDSETERNIWKTRLRDSLQKLPRFRDRIKNFRDPRFSGYHSPLLELKRDLSYFSIILLEHWCKCCNLIGWIIVYYQPCLCSGWRSWR